MIFDPNPRKNIFLESNTYHPAREIRQRRHNSGAAVAWRKTHPDRKGGLKLIKYFRVNTHTHNPVAYGLISARKFNPFEISRG